MRRRRLLRGMGATALAAVLGGARCSVLPNQPYLQRRDWPLTVRRTGELAGLAPGPSSAEISAGSPAPLATRSDRRVLLVRVVQAGPGLETRSLQTLQPDGSLQTAFYEEWAVPPAEGVDDDLRHWLADSGVFAAVLAPGSRMTADFALEGELVTLHADLAGMTARAALALVLIDQRPSATQIRPGRIRLQRTEAADVKLEGTDPPALVRAQLAAVAAVLRQTETVLANAVQP